MRIGGEHVRDRRPTRSRPPARAGRVLQLDVIDRAREMRADIRADAQIRFARSASENSFCASSMRAVVWLVEM